MINYSNKTKQPLGYDVYVYIDPDSKQPFYVGVGNDNNTLNNFNESEMDMTKFKRMKTEGKEPIVKLIAENIDQYSVVHVINAVIKYYGIEYFNNLPKGHVSLNDVLNQFKCKKRFLAHIELIDLGNVSFDNISYDDELIIFTNSKDEDLFLRIDMDRRDIWLYEKYDEKSIKVTRWLMKIETDKLVKIIPKDENFIINHI